MAVTVQICIFQKYFQKIISFAQNFFEINYFLLISFLCERSRSVDAENDQTLYPSPSELRDITTQTL